MYYDNIAQHIAQGHMVKLYQLDLNSPHYFLPNHAIYKPSSTSTKMRVVYDAILSMTLMTGPKLQANIFDVLLNFRTHFN